jgi:hypothetical protein
LENLATNFSRLNNLVTNYGVEYNSTLFHIVPAEVAFVDDALIRRFSDNLYPHLLSLLFLFFLIETLMGHTTFITVTAKPFPHVLDQIEKAIDSISIPQTSILLSLLLLSTLSFA